MNSKFIRNSAVQGSVTASFGDIVLSFENCKFKNNFANYGEDFLSKPKQLRLRVYQVNEAFLYLKQVSIQAMLFSPETVRNSKTLKLFFLGFSL